MFNVFGMKWDTKNNLIIANDEWNLKEAWCPGELYSKDVMQYTGLKDKNGNEIYEGDIICKRYGGNRKGEIYKKCEVKWGTYNIGSNLYEYDCYIVGPYVEDEYMYGSMINSEVEEVEIIGNVHENPDLIPNSN